MDAVSSSKVPDSPASTWAARLNVSFVHAAGRTRVGHSEHFGPLRIQRPFYPEQNGTAHLYLLHPPGGVAGGDQLRIELEANPGAQALVTAPAANKLYRTLRQSCWVENQLLVRDDAVMEWLPQETIAFQGTRAELSTVVHLEEGATFLGWEVLCLGRPAAGESFESGYVHQNLELWREETPLYVDRVRLGESSGVLHAAWGLRGHCVMGTFLMAPGGTECVALAREVLRRKPRAGSFGVTELRGVTVVRYVGDQTTECWQAFVDIWERIRPKLTSRPAVSPRIWSC